MSAAERSAALKESRLNRLAMTRQQTRLRGYFCLHEFAGGKYECPYVSPWSKFAHDVGASIMIVGQDWASEGRLRGPVNYDRVRLGYDPDIPTNINLQDLLRRHFGMAWADVYATNAFPFIKPGGMNGSIPPEDLIPAVEKFLKPQIEIIQPQIAICLGLSTFNAVRQSCGYDKLRTLDDAMKSAFDFRHSKIVAVAHTGARGTNNRGRDRVEQDWAAIRRQFDQLTKRN
jgi:hypothetical protein